MYQVLYRKWRPQVFADVVGQPQVTVTLQHELMAGRVAHAYLFTGSRGTGKTTCAKILAKAVNCLHPVNGDPCGECEICRGVESGSVMDVVEIDAASNNGVDNIRELREEAAFTPASARYRVYIIDEVHMLSQGAFNALLKTLEEPPAHVLFILATTEVHKLPATILSRCQRFDFHRIAPEDISDRLEYVAQQEEASLDREAGLLIARLADGAMRDALSLLDQCFGRSRQVTVEVVNETAGLAGREHLFQMAQSILDRDSPSALELVDRLYRESKDMARLCEELTGHFRGMMLLKTMKDAGSLLVMTREEEEKLAQQAKKAPLALILHVLSALQESLERMYRGGDRRVEMEMTLIRLCTPELEDSTPALVRRIEALERRLAAGIPAAPPKEEAPAKAASSARPESSPASAPAPAAEKPAAPETLSPQSAPAPSPSKEEAAPWQEASSRQETVSQQGESPSQGASSKGDAPSLEELRANAEPLPQWPEILQVLRNYSQSVAAAFHGSSAYVSGNYLLIDVAQDIGFELLRKPAQRERMRDAIRQVTGKVYKLGPYKPQAEAETEKTHDPLAALVQEARQAGIECIEE